MSSWNQSLYLEPVKTQVSEQDAIAYLRSAWYEFYGKYPSNNSLAILWSQTVLETGRFKYCYCYNVGNEKSKPNDGFYWTMYKCSEILNGKEIFFTPPHDQCKFRAFKSAQDGFTHYLKFLANKSRYRKAMKEIHRGDVVQYTKELKKAGYFTASLNLYLKGMTRLNKEFHDRVDELSEGWYTPEPHPTFTENELDEIKNIVGDTTQDSIDRYFSLTDREPPADQFSKVKESKIKSFFNKFFKQ